jgi:hypothetical protein
LGLNRYLHVLVLQFIHELAQLEKRRIASAKHYKVGTRRTISQASDHVARAEALGLAYKAWLNGVHRITPTTAKVAPTEAHEISWTAGVRALPLHGWPEYLNDRKTGVVPNPTRSQGGA